MISITCRGRSDDPGIAGTPVMKSLVMKGLKTIDLLQDGVRLVGSLSKCTGINITGICEILRCSPACLKICKIYLRNKSKSYEDTCSQFIPH